MKIAFCKFAGLANGGTEKYLQSICMLYKKNGHDADFYYTNAAKILNSSWIHPDNDPDRILLLEKQRIDLIKVSVGSRGESSNGATQWIDTDFFNLFSE